MLVDLPGYGYAEAPKGEIKRWTGLIALYLKGRASLRRVLLLLDARFGIKETDKPLMKLLDEAAVSFQIVLTKCDLVEPGELQKRLTGLGQSLAKHVAAHPVIHLTSAHNGAGIRRPARVRGRASRAACWRGRFRAMSETPDRQAEAGEQSRDAFGGAALFPALCRQDHRRQIWRPRHGRRRDRAAIRRRHRALEAGRHEPDRRPWRRAADRRDAGAAEDQELLRRRPARHRSRRRSRSSRWCCRARSTKSSSR